MGFRLKITATMSLPLDTELPSAGLVRQFAAMVYDSFLILAILFISMGIAVVINGNEAITSTPAFFSIDHDHLSFLHLVLD